MNTLETVELSYKMQRENFSNKDENARRIHKTWFEEDTVDYWRHYRMVAPLKPLLERYKDKKWLTVGDGRFGLDSIRLKKIQPGINVLATDISVDLLSEAKEMNFIDDYRAENAESLSFADDSFDFAFCKEAYHHFPRPYIALYEMLRVAKKGVVLVEPNERNDKFIPERMMNVIKRGVKRLIGKPILHPETWNFEVSGNYIYSVSKNEIEKICLGLQLPTVAFYFYNDYYEEGVEFEKAVPGNKVFERVKRKIANDDMLCKLGMRTYQSIIAIMMKESPDQLLRMQLQEKGFVIVDLPENPYLKTKKESLSKPG